MEDSRMDLILKKLNGEDVELVPPMSRIEKIYFKLLGYDIELDPPQSRSEVLLTEYVNGGGGGGGGGDFTWVTITFINADTSTKYEVFNLTGIVDTGHFEIIAGMPTVEVQDETEVTVLLYKGKYAFQANPNYLNNIDPSFFPQTTGGVTLDMDNGMFVVTGDGTITCKGMSWG